MSRATLKVAFDGPAIHDGSMDVRDLAPALLAIGQLCEEANRVLNGESVKATVLVRADFRAGSFEVNLDLVQSLVSQLRSFLSGPDATAAANLIAMLTAGVGSAAGLIRVIRWLRGRRPRNVVILEEGRVRIELDGDAIETIQPVLDLLRDVRVRKAAADAMRPLERPGIDSIAYLTPDQPPEVVTKDDAPSFLAPEPEDEPIIHEERKAAFSIVSISFRDGNKWRLFDGAATINVTIEDEDFLRQVDTNDVVFSKGDILVCTLETQQWRSGDTLRSEHTVTKVLEHRSGARQLSLPLSPPPKPADG